MEGELVQVVDSAMEDITPERIESLKTRLSLIQKAVRDVLKEGIDHDYAVIPGCKKKSLLKPGAEKLGVMFKFTYAFDVETIDMPNGHREYRVRTKINGGAYEGVGCCSTMESKFRYRTGPKEISDKPVPKEYWQLRKDDPAKAQALIGAGNGTAKNPAGLWMITTGGGSKVENTDPADQYNTCLKIAKKRSFVDGIITATGSSDTFTADMEETIVNQDTGEIETPVPPKAETPKSEPVKPPARKPKVPLQPVESPAPVQAEPVAPTEDEERKAIQAEAAAPAEAPAAPAAPSSEDKITPKQVAFLHVALKFTTMPDGKTPKQPWSPEQAKQLIAKWGYTSSKDIKVMHYSDIKDCIVEYGPDEALK